jgi:hypothetical protein
MRNASGPNNTGGNPKVGVLVHLNREKIDGNGGGFVRER